MKSKTPRSEPLMKTWRRRCLWLRGHAVCCVHRPLLSGAAALLLAMWVYAYSGTVLYPALISDYLAQNAAGVTGMPAALSQSDGVEIVVVRRMLMWTPIIF